MNQDSKLAVISPFIHIPETVKLTSCARSTLIKHSELGLFPPMVRLLGGRIAFVRSQVQSWVDSRLASVQGVK
jgi:predicted DNA-binding transcriptional regulator AlpA